MSFHRHRALMPSWCFLVLLLLSVSVAAMNEKATGISFAKKLQGLDVFGVGVRKKGPIKVYAVGMYSSDGVRESLSSLSKTEEKSKALDTLRAGAKGSPTTFLLKMNFKVGAEKMASAISESVATRHSNSGDVESLKEIVLKGVSEKGAAVKGTEIQFDCKPNEGVSVSVDGKAQGDVSSSSLAASFCDVYLDGKCVAPALPASCLDECCAP